MSTPTISDQDVPELLALIKGADSVELKLTVPISDRTRTGSALGVDPLDGQIRQVYFFDTPDLALYENGLVARARRIQRESDDSVIKLRPVVPEELPAKLRDSRSFSVEVDAMPGGYVCSGSMKRTLKAFDVGVETRAFLTERGVDFTGEQETKTKKALEFFAERLQEQNV